MAKKQLKLGNKMKTVTFEDREKEVSPSKKLDRLISKLKEVQTELYFMESLAGDFVSEDLRGVIENLEWISKRANKGKRK